MPLGPEFAFQAMGRPIIQERREHSVPLAPLPYPYAPKPIEVLSNKPRQDRLIEENREFAEQVQHKIDIAPVMPREILLFANDMEDYQVGLAVVKSRIRGRENLEHYTEVDEAGEADVTIHGTDSNLLLIQRRRELTTADGEKAIHEDWFGQRFPQPKQKPISLEPLQLDDISMLDK